MMTISGDAKDVAVTVANRLPAHFLWLALAALTAPSITIGAFVYFVTTVQTARIDGVVRIVELCVAGRGPLQ